MDRKYLLALLFAAGIAAGPVVARSIDDCEKISNPLAYNQCLTEFSPARRHSGASRSPQPAPGYQAPAYDVAPRGYRGSRRGIKSLESAPSVVQRTTEGRKIATFEVGGTSKQRPRVKRLR